MTINPLNIKEKLTEEEDDAAHAAHAEGSSGIAVVLAVRRLARMRPEDCAKHLIIEAAELGIDLTELAERVKKLRNKIVSQIKALRAKTVENGCTEAEVWEAAAKVAQLELDYNIAADAQPDNQIDYSEIDRLMLKTLENTIKRHVVLPKHAHLTCALWIIHSHALDASDISPFLTLSSPIKRCGKTTFLDLLTELVYQGRASSSISPAAMYRMLAAGKYTLLFDEADTFITKENHYFRGILNAGHRRRTAIIVRCEKTNGVIVTKEYSVWGAKVIALLGKLPPTLQDRSIVIRMQRKNKTDKIERFKSHCVEHLKEFAWIITQWAMEHFDRLKDADPVIPSQITNDRAVDNWRPLLAIADLIGGDFPQRAREAMIAMECGHPDELEDGEQLLADCKVVFDKTKQSELSAEELITGLCGLPESEWSKYKGSKPITKKALANLLRPFELYTQKSGPRKNLKRWIRKDFEPVWEAYL